MPRTPRVVELAPLLVVRSQARQLLSCSQSKLLALEKLGKLTPIKLTNAPTAVVHYRYDQLEALARIETAR